MVRKNTLVFIIVLIIFLLAILVVLPIDDGILGKRGVRLGLDLVGGVHLVYQVEFADNATSEEQERGMDRTLEIIRDRIDKYGVTEPSIQTLDIAGKTCISVKLPGFTDIEEAKKLVKQTGFLEFRMVELDEEGDAVYLSDYLSENQTGYFDQDEDEYRLFAEAPYDDGIPIAVVVKNEEGNLEYTDSEGNPGRRSRRLPRAQT